MFVAEPAGGGEGFRGVEVAGGVEDCVLVHFDFGLWRERGEMLARRFCLGCFFLVFFWVISGVVVDDVASRKTVF